MKRPSVPDPLHKAVASQAREHDNSWHQALERILEEKTDIEIPQQVEA